MKDWVPPVLAADEPSEDSAIVKTKVYETIVHRIRSAEQRASEVPFTGVQGGSLSKNLAIS